MENSWVFWARGEMEAESTSIAALTLSPSPSRNLFELDFKPRLTLLHTLLVLYPNPPSTFANAPVDHEHWSPFHLSLTFVYILHLSFFFFGILSS